MEEPNSPYFREQVDDVVESDPQDREVIIVEGEAMSLRSYKKRRY
ncbi:MULTISPECIES: hypothetical protein [Haloferax]|uniref:Uncharacterized protein n=7 Tax=Haloferax TaxID=2251 RepID=A0A871BEB0_HALGI|nr:MULTISPECIES: hypothetical protein [Haloferax]ELZ71721.1 hypothetical protein C457_06721 [Haloferax prahovense DSM 18310]ELZ77214.1 hypothetical protein C454_16311 [Haloferax gibbonsii ATCC 33959]ELZ98653.1 hypothetical protein C441_02224 [Haloferax sulfurifontis ATCC BAA-897]EMA07170.1 hypothetical protein C438_04507 [Haloferax denitrificans ATCC 35960]QOS11457.1 uncharacterized protein HfgLR_06570 [Haloferax gibbonsii]